MSLGIFARFFRSKIRGEKGELPADSSKPSPPSSTRPGEVTSAPPEKSVTAPLVQNAAGSYRFSAAIDQYERDIQDKKSGRLAAESMAHKLVENNLVEILTNTLTKQEVGFRVAAVDTSIPQALWDSWLAGDIAKLLSRQRWILDWNHHVVSRGKYTYVIYSYNKSEVEEILRTVEPAAIRAAEHRPMTLQSLALEDWFFMPDPPELNDFDDATKNLREQLLERYKGWHCAVCATSTCDDGCSILIHAIERLSSSAGTITQFVICRSCMQVRTPQELIDLGKQGRICNALRVAEPRPESKGTGPGTSCSKHLDRRSVAMCSSCQNRVCEECLRIKRKGGLLAFHCLACLPMGELPAEEVLHALRKNAG